MQRLVSPQNTPPNKSFYLPSPFNREPRYRLLFRCACAFTSKILSRILPGLNIAPFPLGLRPILKSKIISHILQPLVFWQEISVESLSISLYTLADTRTLRFRFIVTSQQVSRNAFRKFFRILLPSSCGRQSYTNCIRTLPITTVRHNSAAWRLQRFLSHPKADSYVGMNYGQYLDRYRMWQPLSSHISRMRGSQRWDTLSRSRRP